MLNKVNQESGVRNFVWAHAWPYMHRLSTHSNEGEYIPIFSSLHTLLSAFSTWHPKIKFSQHLEIRAQRQAVTGQSDCEAIPGYLHFGTDTQLRLIQLDQGGCWPGKELERGGRALLSVMPSGVGGVGGWLGRSQVTSTTDKKLSPRGDTSAQYFFDQVIAQYWCYLSAGRSSWMNSITKAEYFSGSYYLIEQIIYVKVFTHAERTNVNIHLCINETYFLKCTRVASGWQGLVQTGWLGGSLPPITSQCHWTLLNEMIERFHYCSQSRYRYCQKKCVSQLRCISHLMWDLFQSQPLLYLSGRQLFGHLLRMSSNMVGLTGVSARSHKLKHCNARRAGMAAQLVPSIGDISLCLLKGVGFAQNREIQCWQIVKLRLLRKINCKSIGRPDDQIRV